MSPYIYMKWTTSRQKNTNIGSLGHSQPFKGTNSVMELLLVNKHLQQVVKRLHVARSPQGQP